MIEPEPAPAAGRATAPLLVSLALVVLLLASAGLATWTYFSQYRVDQETSESVVNLAVNAATAARSRCCPIRRTPRQGLRDRQDTPHRRLPDYYTQFTEEIVSPAAKEKSVKTSAAVVRAAVSDMHPNSAEVLVCMNQTTTSKENPDGAFTASTVKVGLTKARRQRPVVDLGLRSRVAPPTYRRTS